MLQPALGDQGTSHQSRESSETPRYFLNNVMSLIFPTHFSPSFPLAVLPDSTPSYPAHTHTYTHTCTDAYNMGEVFSGTERPLAPPKPPFDGSATHEHTITHMSHMRARAHTDTHNIQPRGRCSLAPNVLWRPQDRSLAVARRA